jgi:hypothetical protein
MSTIAWVLVICGVVLFACFWALVFSNAAAPTNKRERLRDDYEQLKALHYLDSPEGKIEESTMSKEMKNLTSGCPVENNK